MGRITNVVLNGFKGQHTRYALEPVTVLAGPNGLGKSAVLEAIVWALSGKVPSGRSSEEVGKFFGPEGGWVRLEDEEGRWLEREVKRDNRRSAGKVSEEIRTSDTGKDDREPDLSSWKVSDAVLDLREFLALSANKRREFVLDLCGSGGVVSLEELGDIVATYYAREIGGAMAKSEDLLSPEDFPEDARDVAAAWDGDRGIAEVLDATVTQAGDELDPTTTFAAWVKVASEQKNAAKRAKDEALAASQELETGLEGARAAAAEVNRRRRERDGCAEAVSAAREEAARQSGVIQGRRGLLDALGAAAKALVAKDAEVGVARSRLEAIREPGPEVPEAGYGDSYRKAEADLKAADYALATAKDATSRAEEWENGLAQAGRMIDQAKARLKTHRLSPMGKVRDLIEEIPDDAHPNVLSLRLAIEEVSEHWRESEERIAEEIQGLEDQYARAKASSPAAPSADVRSLGAAREAARAALERETRAVEAAHRSRVDWEHNRDAHARAWEAYVLVQSARDQAKDRVVELQRAVDSAPEFPPDQRADTMESDLYKAEAALKGALEASGRVHAYADAIARAKEQETAHEAWKVAERAIKAAREVYVEGSTRPIIGDLDRLLERAGRSERAYLRLENTRGTPIFDIGWVRDGAEIPVQALSGGEAVIFCAALSIAFAARSEGRKVLLVEADPLDHENLRAIVTALLGFGPSLDACLLATSEARVRDWLGGPRLGIEIFGEPRAEGVQPAEAVTE